jgi:crotonobetainyl-CoA:carnitine CoA-transferase CaiB-like acyl-CoA transferase
MSGPLENMKVVELATMAAVPMAGRLLADWGADVIHIEHPVTGDPWRTWLTQGGVELPDRLSYHWWENYNRNKRSLTLDISHEKGQEVLRKLIGEADVFLCNRRPYEIKRYKLDYETLSRLNKRLIYGSLTGYGRKGPDKDAPGQDTIGFWARSGFMYQMQQGGTAPPSPGYRAVAAGDKVSGMTMACGILLAILAREQSGVGQEVDVSLLNTGIYAQSPLALHLGGYEEIYETQEEYEAGLRKEREDVSPLYISFETKDKRWLQLSLAPPDRYWTQFCQAIEMPELEKDPRFDSIESRMENQPEFFKLIESIFLEKSLAEWIEQLEPFDLLWSPIQSPKEVLQDPQVLANDYIVPFDHPEFGEIDVIANPIKHSKTPATLRTPAPEFSQHTEEILLEMGYTWEDIGELSAEGTIA